MSGCNYVKAQHVNFSNFYLIPNDKEVLMYWTIDSGSTCNGITVWHSTDSINYTEIGRIYGVCGSSSSSTLYNFTHKFPQLNTKNYYKLQLGYSQFTKAQTIFIKYIEPGILHLFPNPSTGETTIEFNNEQLMHYSIIITNKLGKLVYKKEEILEEEILLNTAEWDQGTYSITVSDNSGKILQEKLIIIN